MENEASMETKNKASKGNVLVWNLFDTQVEVKDQSCWKLITDTVQTYAYINGSRVVQVQCINGHYDITSYRSNIFDIFDFKPCDKSEVETAFNNALNQFKNLLQ